MSQKEEQQATPARSWAELVESVQDGFAVLDSDARLVFVSDRFLAAIGTPADMVGHAVEYLLPALAEDDPRQLNRKLRAGESIQFEHHVVASDGEAYWYQLTVVPSTQLGADLRAVVFARDISSTSRRLHQLRAATTELTRVENERHRRVSREVHDGPVQLLAALVFRLGMSGNGKAKELQHAASEVASTMRTVIEEFSLPVERIDGSLIRQWIAPMLDGSGLDVHVQDDRSAPSGLAEAQAAFVLLYQVVRAVRDSTAERTLTLHLTDEDGGERMLLTMPSRKPESLTGKRALRLQAIADHAQGLGGTLAHSLDDDNVRTLSMWIPKLTNPVRQSGEIAELRQSPQPLLKTDLADLPPLSDAAWLEIVDAAPERMAEIDAERHISFANTTMADGIGIPASDLIGADDTVMLNFGDVDDVDDIFSRLRAGELVQTRWQRAHAYGDPKRAHITMSPRLDDTGQLASVFISTNEGSDLDMLDELYETALADLTQARHLAIETTVHRLFEPLAECQKLIKRLDEFERFTEEPGPVRTIKRGLDRALRSIKSSSSVFTAAPHSTTEFVDVLQESLGTILEGRDLVVVDTTDTPPPDEAFDPMFRIAREAVNNAVLHGRAETIIISIGTTDDGTTCTVHDDGVGLGPGQLTHQPGHLGTRSMQARARERGGNCTIAAHPTVGTVVSLWLPADPTHRS